MINQTKIKNSLTICEEEIIAEATKQGLPKEFGEWMFRYECFANYYFADTEGYGKFISKWLPKTEEKFPKISIKTCLAFVVTTSDIFAKHDIWLTPVPDFALLD